MAEWLLGISTTNPQQPLEMDLELESRRSRLLQRMETAVCVTPLEVLAGDGMPDTAEMDETTNRCFLFFLLVRVRVRFSVHSHLVSHMYTYWSLFVGLWVGGWRCIIHLHSLQKGADLRYAQRVVGCVVFIPCGWKHNALHTDL